MARSRVISFAKRCGLSPRLAEPGDRPAERYLATRTRTGYAVPDAPGTYIHDRVAATTTFEITATEEMAVESMAQDRAIDRILCIRAWCYSSRTRL
jgi:hypothetical protein